MSIACCHWAFRLAAVVPGLGMIILAGQAKAIDPAQAPVSDAFAAQVGRLLENISKDLGEPRTAQRDRRARAAALLIALYALHDESGGSKAARASLFERALWLENDIASGKREAITRQMAALAARQAIPIATLEAQRLERRIRVLRQDLFVKSLWFSPQSLGGLGIEEKLRENARKGSTLGLADLDGPLLEAARHAAVIAEWQLGREPPLPEHRDLWDRLGQQMRAGSRDLARAVRLLDPPAAAGALARVTNSCTTCHRQFLFSLPLDHSLPVVLDTRQPLQARIAAAYSLGTLKRLASFRGNTEEKNQLQRELDARLPVAIPQLLGVLKEENWALRQAVQFALDQMGCTGDSKVAGILEMLKKEELYPRFWISYLLRNVREAEQAVAVLRVTLAHPDKTVARAAGAMLGQMLSDGKLDLPEALTWALQDSDPVIRGRASLALARLGKPAVAGLIEVTRGEQRDARAAAAFALGKIGADARAAVPALREMQKGADEYLRLAANLALKKIEANPKP
jgi:hypothetical protein